MNQTIRNDVRSMLLGMIGVNLNSVSAPTRAELRRVAKIDENENNAEGMIEVCPNNNQIAPGTIVQGEQLKNN